MTIKQQAQELLSSGAPLPDSDREFLEFVAGSDFTERPGVLHKNPDGTYAPMNTKREPVLADSANGRVSVKPGYAFRDDADSFVLRSGRVLSNATATATDFSRLKVEAPLVFRERVIRGWYETTHPYWVP